MLNKWLGVFILVLVVMSCTSKAPERLIRMSQDQLLAVLNNHSDTTYVINFWATTCKPCIIEMPELIDLADQYENKKLKMVLISLDPKEHLGSRVVPFIQKHGMEKYAYWLDAPNYNNWIGQVDADYWGSMPATLIINYQQNQRIFINRQLEPGELAEVVGRYF